jgi:phosphatidate phosphatase LPIN
MDALRLWRDTSILDTRDRSLSPQRSLSRAPSPISDEEDGKQEKGPGETERDLQRVHGEPFLQPVSTKPTSSSWVRWWSRRSDRNREVKEIEKVCYLHLHD